MHYLLVVLAVGAISCGRCSDSASKQHPAVAAPRRTDARPARRNWAPPPAPSLPAWSAAEVAKTTEGWNRAADAYARAREGCVDDCLDAAYAVVLARKNALGADPIQPPQPDEAPPLPPRVKALVDALDDYVKIAPPSDPDVVDMKFLAANALNRWHQDDAVARLEELLREHRDDPVAEYAANMLLDALVRANRIEELKGWVTELLADSTFLAGKDELRTTLEAVRARIAPGSPRP
jgi:hypothetical protein